MVFSAKYETICYDIGPKSRCYGNIFENLSVAMATFHQIWLDINQQWSKLSLPRYWWQSYFSITIFCDCSNGSIRRYSLNMSTWPIWWHRSESKFAVTACCLMIASTWLKNNQTCCVVLKKKSFTHRHPVRPVTNALSKWFGFTNWHCSVIWQTWTLGRCNGAIKQDGLRLMRLGRDTETG